jgi:hypothetical protein
MLHAAGGAGLAAKSLLGRLIANESLTQDFERDLPVD